MSQQQVSESLERIKTDDDIYFGVTTVHVTFLPLKKVSGWCLCCGFAGGVLWAYFCFGGFFFLVILLFLFLMAEDLPTFVHSVHFPFLLAVICLELLDKRGQ